MDNTLHGNTVEITTNCTITIDEPPLQHFIERIEEEIEEEETEEQDIEKQNEEDIEKQNEEDEEEGKDIIKEKEEYVKDSYITKCVKWIKKWF
jgi:cell division ATPase FtsA